MVTRREQFFTYWKSATLIFFADTNLPKKNLKYPQFQFLSSYHSLLLFDFRLESHYLDKFFPLSSFFWEVYYLPNIFYLNDVFQSFLSACSNLNTQYLTLRFNQVQHPKILQEILQTFHFQGARKPKPTIFFNHPGVPSWLQWWHTRGWRKSPTHAIHLRPNWN